MLDVSSISRIKGVRYFFSELNQLYHPTGEISQDSQSLVYSFGNLNITKFVPILLKEWFFLVKEKEYLVIDYRPNERCDFAKLEEQMWWLWKGKYEIVYHGPVEGKDLQGLTEKKLQDFIQAKEGYYQTNLDNITLLPVPLPTEIKPKTENGYLRFVCKKTVSTVIPGDAITKWTFGIITNGKRKDWMEQIIASVRAQKIPNYEIIVCGTYFQPKDKDIKYIPFNQRDDNGWITRKKNLIVQHATYENLCIIHDRIVFDKEWYKGMKKWGNTFEHMSCQQLFNGYRAGDWCIVEDKYLTFKGKKSYFVSSLDYRDWYSSSFITGTMHIGKKSILKNSWNETLFWNQAEDYTLTVSLLAKGILPRFNDRMKVESLAWRFTIDTNVPFNIVTDTKMRKAPIIKLVGRNGMYYMNRLFNSDKLVAFAWKLFFETKWFKKR